MNKLNTAAFAILFFLHCFHLASAFGQSPLASQVLSEYSGFKIERSETQTKDGKVVIWGNPESPHLQQKFDRSGRLTEEREYFAGSKKLRSVHEHFFRDGSSRKIFFAKDGQKPIRIQTSVLKGDLVFTTIEDLLSGSRIVLPSEVNQREAAQSKDFCLPSASSYAQVKAQKAFEQVFTNLQVQGKSKNYWKTSMGVWVDEACLKKRETFLFDLQESLTTGLACLNELKTSKTEMMISKMASIFDNKENPLKIRCNEVSGFNWSGFLAYASTGPHQSDHPIISINPQKVSHPDLKETLFHELFHNIGYRHGTDPEVADTCASCCFGKKKNYNYKTEEKAVELACELCGGDYLDVTDLNYLRQLTNWSVNAFSTMPQNLLISQILAEDSTERADLKMQLLLESFAAFGISYGSLNTSLVAHLSKTKPDLLPKGLDLDRNPVSFPSIKASTDVFAEGFVAISRRDHALAFDKIIQAWKLLPKGAPSGLSTSDKERFESQLAEIAGLYDRFGSQIALRSPEANMFITLNELGASRSSSNEINKQTTSQPKDRK